MRIRLESMLEFLKLLGMLTISAMHSTHRPRTYHIQLSSRQRDSDIRTGMIRPSEGKQIPGSIKSCVLPGKLCVGAAYTVIAQ